MSLKLLIMDTLGRAFLEDEEKGLLLYKESLEDKPYVTFQEFFHFLDYNKLIKDPEIYDRKFETVSEADDYILDIYHLTNKK